MPAYMVSAVKITAFTDGLKQYIDGANALLHEHGGEYLVRGAAAAVLEGDYLDGRSVVVARFPSMAALRAFYDSDRYQSELKPRRENTGIYDVAAFEAVE